MAVRYVVQAIGSIFLLFFISWKLTLVHNKKLTQKSTGEKPHDKKSSQKILHNLLTFYF